MKMKFRNPYNDEENARVSKLTAITTSGESKTIQNAPDSDINELLQRFGVTDGSILPAQLGDIDLSYYGDHTEEVDLRRALDINRNAEETFRKLPAKIRERFNNNALNMLTWVSDRENTEEAIRLGLLTKRAEPKKPEPMEVRIIDGQKDKDDKTVIKPDEKKP